MSTTDPVPTAGSRRRRMRGSRTEEMQPRPRPASAYEAGLLTLRGPWLPALTLTAAAGLLILSVGLAVSRSSPGSDWAEPLFWTGLLLVVVPFAGYLATATPTRGERLTAVLVLGLLLYLVKIVHDPYAFVYADEWVHVYNAQEIVRSGSLFHANPIIPVTARYPGLETVTAALASTSGLGIFASGLVVLGAARIALVLGLFLGIERLTGSARIAGLAAVVYLTNPNFLFWSAQFSYESLALPLVVIAAAATIAMLPADEPSRAEHALHRHERASWAAVACLAALAVAATHHLSSWALCAFLVVTCLVAWLRRTGGRGQAPWLVAGVAVAAAVFWSEVVAPGTGSYLFPVLRRAVHEAWDTLLGHGSGRGLFEAGGDSHAQTARVWQRVIAIASVALIVVGLPLGLRQVARRYRRNAFAVTLAIAAVVYVAILPMRLVPAAWETSNRSSEFLFVGVALTLSVIGLAYLPSRRVTLGAAACAGILLIGGVVAGWPPRVLLSLPYRADASGAVVSPQPAATAAWAKRVLGPGRRFIAPEAVGRELLVHGSEIAYVTSASFDARAVLYGPDLTAGNVETLGDHLVRYVAVDRRVSGDDSMAGYFFPRPGDDELVDPLAVHKYDEFPGVDRILDTGDIVVYDVQRLWSVPG